MNNLLCEIMKANDQFRKNAIYIQRAHITITQRSFENRGGNDNLIEKSAKDMDSLLEEEMGKWPLNI